MEHYVIKPAGEAGEAAVHAGLRAYNRTFVSDTADLSLVVEDEAGQIIGGCDAFRMGELALLDVCLLYTSPMPSSPERVAWELLTGISIFVSD